MPRVQLPRLPEEVRKEAIVVRATVYARLSELEEMRTSLEDHIAVCPNPNELLGHYQDRCTILAEIARATEFLAAFEEKHNFLMD